MKDIDLKIREALRAEESALLDSVGGPQPIYQELLDVFRGRDRFLVMISVVVTLVMLIGAVYCGIQFSAAHAVRGMIMWGAAAFFCISGVMLMKIWFWMEMSKNAVTREVKRLELQLAQLAIELRGSATSPNA